MRACLYRSKADAGLQQSRSTKEGLRESGWEKQTRSGVAWVSKVVSMVLLSQATSRLLPFGNPSSPFGWERPIKQQRDCTWLKNPQTVLLA